MQPAEPLQRPGRESCLFLQLSSSTDRWGFSVVDETGRQLKLPALYRVAVVPDEDEPVMIEDGHYYRKVVQGEPEMVCSKTRLRDYPVSVNLHFSKVDELPRPERRPGLRILLESWNSSGQCSPAQRGFIALLEDGRFFVASENLPTHIHDLAEGRVCPDCLDYGIHRVGLLVLERLPQTLERVLHLDIVTRLSDLCDPLDLAPLSLLIAPQSLDRLLLINLLPVDTHNDPVSLLQLLLVTVGGVGDLALEESRLDSVQQPSGAFYLVKVLERLLLHLIREPFDIVGPAERINSVRHASLFC